MKIWDIIFRVIILVIGVVLITFSVLLYHFCERQKLELNSMKDKQDVEAEFNSNKFKYQEDQIERLSKNLDDARQQIKGQNDMMVAQKDAFLQEVEKRQQVENDSKSIQTSLVDIKAEADAIKQDMKGWQKDYVTVLAGLEKKMGEDKYEIKAFEDGLAALNIPQLKENINSLKNEIEKVIPSPDNGLSGTVPAPDTNASHTQVQS